MRYIRPFWLGHRDEQKDFEVYSCHVSPDGQRLATAGGDGHVRVWSTDAIFRDHTPGYRGPRLLCHMSHHLGTIHCVRFSPNGRYLASCADDKLICIYILDKGQPAMSYGPNEPPPVENWKTYKRLYGHDNDVQDLAWSCDSSLLVSVGLDSKVVVWSGHTFEKLKTLANHQSQVKGVTFDPANKYFATASDDRTIKIFRFTPPAPNATQHDVANNFVLETTINGPFKSSPLTTYFRRCSWSPDGNHIAAANGVNGPVSSVAIIERTRWDSDINLVGHEGPTEVCMFSPRLFHTTKPSENGGGGGSEALVTVIASAGQDKTVTIWNTCASRPVLVTQNLATKSISDLSWTPDGQTLFVSSLDGSVVVVKFEVGELGWAATPEENDKALQKFGASRKGMGLAEDVEGLTLENLSKAGESRAVESRMGALMGDVPAGNDDAAAAANGTKGKEAAASGGGGASRAGVNGTAITSEQEPAAPAAENSADKMEQVKNLKSRVTIGKDGKKRVAPLLVSSSGTGLSSLPQTQLVGSTARSAAQNDGPVSILDLSRPYEGLPKGGIVSLILGNKRRAIAAAEDEEGEEDEVSGGASSSPGGPRRILAATADGGVEPAPSNHTVDSTPPEYLRRAMTNPSVAVSSVRLGVPKIRSHIVRPLERGVLHGDVGPDDASRPSESIVFEARNPVLSKDPTAISVTKRGALVWQDYLPRAIMLVTGSKHFWAAACEDGTVHLWSPAGRRLLNPILVESQPVVLDCREYWLLCVTSVGMCYVWDMRTQRSPHPPVALGPLLEIAWTTVNVSAGPTQGPGISGASLNSTGHLVVTLTSGDGFFYNRDMYTWQRVSEAWWAVGSQYWNSNDSSISALQSSAVGPRPSRPAATSKGSALVVSAGIIPYLERHTTSEFLLRGRGYALQRIIKSVLARDGFEGFESTVSIAHLENRVAAAMQLGSTDEFRLYLFMYAKRIGSEGLKAKAEELLAWLIGGLFENEEARGSSETGRGWFGTGDEVCGCDRKELLEGVVMILGKYRELQRLVVPYARAVQITLDSNQAMDTES